MLKRCYQLLLVLRSDFLCRLLALHICMLGYFFFHVLIVRGIFNVCMWFFLCVSTCEGCQVYSLIRRISAECTQNYLSLERSRGVHKAQHNLRENGIFCCCCRFIMKLSLMFENIIQYRWVWYPKNSAVQVLLLLILHPESPQICNNNTTWMEKGGRRWKGSNSLIWNRHKKVDLLCDLEHDCKKAEEVNGSTWHSFFFLCVTGLWEGRRSWRQLTDITFLASCSRSQGGRRG